jgi:hypothetical protein
MLKEKDVEGKRREKEKRRKENNAWGKHEAHSHCD